MLRFIVLCLFICLTNARLVEHGLNTNENAIQCIQQNNQTCVCPECSTFDNHTNNCLLKKCFSYDNNNKCMKYGKIGTTVMFLQGFPITGLSGISLLYINRIDLFILLFCSYSIFPLGYFMFKLYLYFKEFPHDEKKKMLESSLKYVFKLFSIYVIMIDTLLITLFSINVILDGDGCVLVK